MAHGLRIKNTSGGVILEITDRLTRVLGSFSTGTSNGSFTIDQSYGGADTFFVCQTPVTGDGFRAAVFTISGRTISWTFPYADGTSRVSTTVVFGIY